MTDEELWAQVDRELASRPILERPQLRRLLIRRLQHPEMGAHPESTPPQNNRRGYPPRIASPLCWCGAPRSLHAEDGSFDPNGCPQFVSAR